MGLPPQYVLDEIEIYEINSLIKYSYKKYKNSWQQTRLISYLIAQTNSTKKLKLEDIMKFHWENDTDGKKDESAVTKEELYQMMKEADEMKKIMFGE